MRGQKNLTLTWHPDLKPQRCAHVHTGVRGPRALVLCTVLSRSRELLLSAWSLWVQQCVFCSVCCFTRQGK